MPDSPEKPQSADVPRRDPSLDRATEALINEQPPLNLAANADHDPSDMDERDSELADLPTEEFEIVAGMSDNPDRIEHIRAVREARGAEERAKRDQERHTLDFIRRTGGKPHQR